MKIIVNAHTLKLEKDIDVNSGEYNVQNVEFTFSSEYDNLTKMAIFTNGSESYKAIITDNKCIIPIEVIEEGTICAGVYGYEQDGDTLIKRYSPKPVYFSVEPGSYQIASEGGTPSPDVIEQILQELENQAGDITQLQNNYDNLVENTIPGIENSIPTKTSELENNSGFITSSDLPDLTNYVKNTDYSTDSTGGVIKTGYGSELDVNGTIRAKTYSYSDYSSMANSRFIGKGTLENVITGKDLTTKTYVDGLVGDINTILATLTTPGGE